MDSMELIRHDLESHAKTITVLVEDQREIRDMIHELETDREVRRERDRNINEKFEGLNAKLDDIRSIGKWILLAFATVIVAAVANFIVRGGLLGPLP